jgi:hypothetical protein
MGLPALLLLLVLLGAMLFGAYFLGLFDEISVSSSLRNIPVVGAYFSVPSNINGEVVVLKNAIRDRFVENKASGTLFVVTGKVRNDFPSPRSYIEVVGRPFSSGRKPAGVESVFCGNSLTDEELTSLPSDRIKNILHARAGRNNSNIDVRPGKVLPYMIVFDNLPDQLDELSVEVKGSHPSNG